MCQIYLPSCLLCCFAGLWQNGLSVFKYRGIVVFLAFRRVFKYHGACTDAVSNVVRLEKRNPLNQDAETLAMLENAATAGLALLEEA